MIWIVGSSKGTYKVRDFVAHLNLDYKITIVMDYKKDSALSYSSLAINKPLTKEEIKAYILQEKATTIVDTTYEVGHSFSANLIETANEMNLKYIRFEEKLPYIDSYDTAANVLSYTEVSKEAILLQINRKTVTELAELIKNAPVYIQCENNLLYNKCISLGIDEEKLIKVEKPFDAAQYGEVLNALGIKKIALEKFLLEPQLIKLYEANKVKVMALCPLSYPVFIHELETLKNKLLE